MKKIHTLESLMQDGCQFLGTKYAIMGGAMTWVSERNLVAAISNAGGFGVVACGSMTPELLDAEIKATQKLTKNPFGVNLIVMHPKLDDLAQTCINNRVSHVVLAGGVPKKALIQKLKDGGCKVISFAPALVIGKKLLKDGIDALIVEGSEAGGHIGPVSTSVLAQEILPNISEVPVFVAGGIGRGEAILSYLEMGAAGVQLGTRFVCARECVAHPKFKRAFINAASRDAMPSAQIDPRFPVIPVRALQNEGTKRFMEKQREVIAKYESGVLSMDAAQLEIEHFWAGALRRAAIDGDVENGSLMAGQSVGMVSAEQTTQEIIDELIYQADHALNNKIKYA
ncbi:MAG: 2-nitropropane dioxygenase [Alphaproteobacteria bacterium]|nr:MAG: 2-nitropropane dioxygenase [Alphaproteobacteria bacterium]